MCLRGQGQPVKSVKSHVKMSTTPFKTELKPMTPVPNRPTQSGRRNILNGKKEIWNLYVTFVTQSLQNGNIWFQANLSLISRMPPLSCVMKWHELNGGGNGGWCDAVYSRSYQITQSVTSPWGSMGHLTPLTKNEHGTFEPPPPSEHGAFEPLCIRGSAPSHFPLPLPNFF